MLIVALVLAVIGLAALVTAVVTSNELVAWVCIAASVLGVILLIVDAIRERQGRNAPAAPAPAEEPEQPAQPDESAEDPADAVAYSDEEQTSVDGTYSTFDADYPDELVSEDPESDLPDDDEPELPEAAEEAAIHPIEESAEDGADGEGAEDPDGLDPDDLDAEDNEDTRTGEPATEPDKH